MEKTKEYTIVSKEKAHDVLDVMCVHTFNYKCYFIITCAIGTCSFISSFISSLVERNKRQKYSFFF